jgi:glucokinase
MEKRIYAAIDLGGTKIYTVIAEEDGPILARIQQKTRAQDGPVAVMEQIATSVGDALAQSNKKWGQLTAAGICLAGFFDWKRRIMIHSPNIPGWEEIPVEKQLFEKLGVPVLAENDANAAALGEAHRGAAQGSRDVVYITVSTGIGAGLVTDGKIYRGTRGFAGEAGHMVVKPDGPICGCGRRGCLETVASGTAIAKSANHAIEKGHKTSLTDTSRQNKGPVTAPDVFKAAQAGDPIAIAIIAEAIHYLGIGLVNLVNLLNPQVLVVGGGVSEAGEQLFLPLQKIIAEHAVPPAAASVTLRKAALGVEAGVTGMLCLLKEFAK